MTKIRNEQLVDLPYIGMFKDTRDNNLYKTIKLGTQTWMIDNLRYLPSVDTNATFASKGTAGDPAYGVYDTTAPMCRRRNFSQATIPTVFFIIGMPSMRQALHQLAGTSRPTQNGRPLKCISE